MARSFPGLSPVREDKEEEEGVFRLVEEDRRREGKTGGTLSVFVEKESPLGSGRGSSGICSPYFGSGVAACPSGLFNVCNCPALGRDGASMTVVDTAQMGKNAWPPAESSSVLVGAPALLSERSVSGSLRLPGTFHGRVRMDLKTGEESPFGRRRKTRERKPWRRCQFLSKSEVRFGLKKRVAVRTVGLVSPHVLLVCSSPVIARPLAVTAFRRPRWSPSRRVKNMASGRNFGCLGRGPCRKVQSVGVSSGGLAALRTPARPFWSSLE